ncbi:GntR family transcriptional regulator [Streptomyces sp. NPDC001351]|uniref:GntR family transcriptional regulator n=1 Tax=Streptomyces sp. NPDC001351 TaxID=3364564 RepID=UPI00369F74B5
MIVTVDHASRTPLAEQIAACVRRGPADGTIRKSERLPGARTPAATLGVNMHTVLRAYQQLNEDRLIEPRPGRGAVVTAHARPPRPFCIEACQHIVQSSRVHGLTHAVPHPG